MRVSVLVKDHMLTFDDLFGKNTTSEKEIGLFDDARRKKFESECYATSSKSILSEKKTSVVFLRSAECQSKTPIKTLYQADIVEENQRLYFFLRANAFLHHMVRNIVGSLILVGREKQPPEWIDYSD
jgi:tRNA pseudouridine38-40 synthase